MKVFRRVPGQYFWPLLCLVGLCFGSILALLTLTTSVQDRMEGARERLMLTRALDTQVAMVSRDLEDYAKWDDAVRHIARKFDAGWIDDNVTAYLGRTQGYSHVFVIGPDGRTRYAFSRGRLTRGDAKATLGTAFATSVAAVQAMDPAEPAIASGFTRIDGRLYIYSVAAIVPLTAKIALPPGGRYALAIAGDVDDAFLTRMRNTYELPPLSIDLRKGAVPLNDYRGRPLAWIAMEAQTPGTILRDQMLPGLMLILLLAFCTAGFVLQQGSQAVADLRASKARAIHHANHDPLTGLPNRRVFTERVRERLDSGAEVSLVYMDLDGFKEVNDLYGHRAGDDLLRAVAVRIRMAADAAGEPDMLVARMGGDEFAILHGGVGPADAPALARQIIDRFQTVFPLGGANVRVGVSIGVVTTPLDCALNVDELMRRADVAMYNAKARGTNRWDWYAPDMDSGHDVRKRLEHDLGQAIAANAIEVAYQPIVSAMTGEILCVEALARWTHPVEGLIAPDVFIPLAEMTGLIGALGEQVLAKACRAVAPLDLDLAVNLSPAQFWDAHLVSTIAGVLEREGFAADRLELEITENYLMHRPDAAAGVMEELRMLGIRLALDDFGSGYASVGYLRQLKFERLKIDKQFLRDACAEPASAELLVAIVALGRALQLEITAEGVETEEQAALVRACGCHRAQGWLFGRPIAESALAEMVARMRGVQVQGVARG
ncbi:EAL domain-containing protein [soil metagenome]